MRVKCDLNGEWCELPEYITEFILAKSLVYVNTISRENYPIIQSLLFVNEHEKCNLRFLVNSKSNILVNLNHNPFLTLTLDKTHPSNPLRHEGIMIEAKAHLTSSANDIQLCYNELLDKYGVEIVTKILGAVEMDELIAIGTIPNKIVHWKGPFFQKLDCSKRKRKSASLTKG